MSAPSILDSAASWRRMIFTVLAGTIGNAGMWTVIVVLPEMEREFEIGRSISSLIFVSTMLGFAIGNLLTGKLSDKFGVVVTLMIAAGAVGFGHLIVAASPSLLVIGLAQFLIGIGTAASFGPLLADISHWFLRRRGIAMSIAASANYTAGVIWPLALNQVMPSWGWQQSYAAIGIIALIGVPPMAYLLRKSVPAEAKAISDAQAASRTKATGFSPSLLTTCLFIAGIACCVAMSMPQVHIVSLCIDLGFGPAVGAEMLSLMLFGGIFSRLAGGMLADRLGGLRTLLLFGALQMTALFLYIPFDGLASLYIVSLIFGLSQGGLVPTYAVVVREFLPANVAGARVGLIMMATILGMALGGWLSGVIHDLTGTYFWAFANGILWNALHVGLIAFLLIRSGGLQFGGRAGKAAQPNA